MKIGLAIHHHSPGYGGPFTVVSESAKYLYENKIDTRIFFDQTQFSNFNLKLREIVKSRDLIHLFGIWDPFHAKVFFQAKIQKKNLLFPLLVL
tara:strand:- start:243 stop:521 length:279 start_codon:yes stop_codon:yes gene_type:complete